MQEQRQVEIGGSTEAFLPTVEGEEQGLQLTSMVP